MEVKIIHRKLGREKAYGLAHSEGLIEIDSRLKGFRYMMYLIHEFMHIRHPDWSEKKVRSESHKMAKLLWKSGFRESMSTYTNRQSSSQ